MTRGFVLLLLLILSAPLGAVAQVVSLSPPETIWASKPDGNAVHMQSGLPCPLSVGDFRRFQLAAFDKSGFDVACDYRVGGSEITLYLTRIDPAKFGELFADAKETVEKRNSTAKPREGSFSLPSGFSWSRASYLIPERNVITELLMAPIHDWYLEYRITYPGESEAAVTSAIHDLSDAALKEAGGHFSACEAAPAIDRKGKLVSNNKDTPALVLMTGALMGKITTVDGVTGASKEETTGIPAPKLSCAASGFSIGSVNFIYWHDAGAHDEIFDRITSVDGKVIVFMQDVRPFALVQAMNGVGTAPAKYAVIVDDGDNWDIMAFFDEMPDMEAFATAALLNKEGPLARVSKTGNKIQVEPALLSK